MTDIKEVLLPKNSFGIETPLRYPGGKSSIAGFLSEVIDAQRGEITTYVEPFAGGAGSALILLMNEKVERIVINDLDPAVFCFWKAITEQNRRFLATLNATEITMEEWYRQRDIYRKHDLRKKFQLGFAFFFLNRCNRSGIVKGGVIGGIEQSGEYKLDARFNKEKLSKKIERIGSYSSRIDVLNEDGQTVFERYSKDKHSLIYLDPPYVKQGESLYLNAFRDKDHVSLATCIKRQARANWILTYDCAELICSSKCYGNENIYRYSLRYSAQNRRKEQEFLICSDSLKDVVEAYIA